MAIARALANRPGLILADEPTGNLDPRTAEDVFALLIEVVRDTGTAALIATHNPDLAARLDATFRLAGGRASWRRCADHAGARKLWIAVPRRLPCDPASGLG